MMMMTMLSPLFLWFPFDLFCWGEQNRMLFWDLRLHRRRRRRPPEEKKYHSLNMLPLVMMVVVILTRSRDHRIPVLP